jgi:hypothetical protein
LYIIYIKNKLDYMNMSINNHATLKIDKGFLVVERAFEKDGVFHDIVVSNGDHQYKLGDTLDKDLKERIQNVYLACVYGNRYGQSSSSPEEGYFVYTKTPPQSLNPGITRTQVISANLPSPINIGTVQLPGQGGTPTVDDVMCDFAHSLDVFSPEYGVTVKEPLAQNGPPTAAGAVSPPVLNGSNPAGAGSPLAAGSLQNAKPKAVKGGGASAQLQGQLGEEAAKKLAEAEQAKLKNQQAAAIELAGQTKAVVGLGQHGAKQLVQGMVGN